MTNESFRAFVVETKMGSSLDTQLANARVCGIFHILDSKFPINERNYLLCTRLLLSRSSCLPKAARQMEEARARQSRMKV